MCAWVGLLCPLCLGFVRLGFARPLSVSFCAFSCSAFLLGFYSSSFLFSSSLLGLSFLLLFLCVCVVLFGCSVWVVFLVGVAIGGNLCGILKTAYKKFFAKIRLFVICLIYNYLLLQIGSVWAAGCCQFFTVKCLYLFWCGQTLKMSIIYSYKFTENFRVFACFLLYQFASNIIVNCL